MLRIETPQVEGARGGLLNALDPIKVSPQEINFAEQLEGVIDGVPNIISLFREQEGAISKTAFGAENIDTFGFTAYTMANEPLLYGVDASDQVKEAHERGLSVALEGALESRLLAVNAVDLTPVPGTPVTSARAALGLLEQYASISSGFMPMIHTNRLGASMLRDLKVDESNWQIHTKQGTPVANGGGYTSETEVGGVTASDTQAWVYITTGLIVMQTDHQVVQGYELKRNEVSALVETDFLVANAGVICAVLLGME